MRRVVFEATILGRVVAGGDDDAVGFISVRAIVIGEDCVGHRRSWREAITRILEGAHAVRREDLERCFLRWSTETMCIGTNKQGTCDALEGAIFHNRLRGGEDVLFVERGI